MYISENVPTFVQRKLNISVRLERGRTYPSQKTPLGDQVENNGLNRHRLVQSPGNLFVVEGSLHWGSSTEVKGARSITGRPNALRGMGVPDARDGPLSQRNASTAKEDRR